MKMNINHCYTMSWWIEKKIRIAKWKKNRDIKTQKIKNKNIIPRIQQNYVPRFSFHALERISQRMCEPVKERWYVEVNWVRLWYTKEIKWIRPKFLKKVISDIRNSFKSYIYSTYSDTIMTKWELAKYIIARWWEVITVITDEKVESKYMKKHKYTTIVWHNLELFILEKNPS